MTAAATPSGLAGIEHIAYGTHVCHFYESVEDLATVLVPYFAAGLRNNERCVWVAASPLEASSARAYAQRAGLDVDAAVRTGALSLVDHTDWYAEAGSLKGTDVVELWLAEEARALAQGYSGLRITGNVTFLTPETWDLFMEYEEAIDRALRGRRIVALCTYPRAGGAEILDVSRRHHCTLHTT